MRPTIRQWDVFMLGVKKGEQTNLIETLPADVMIGLQEFIHFMILLVHVNLVNSPTPVVPFENDL